MELLTGLLGAIIGGVLAMAGSAFQSHLQTKQSERQFERQRKLADEDHQRRQAVVENERVRVRIEAQLTYGRKVMIAAARFKAYAGNTTDEAKLTSILADAVRFSGLDFSAPSPFPQFVTEAEIEDGELRSLIARHRKIISEVDAVVIMYDARPADLPNCHELLAEVDELARRIDLRCRVLQRQGLPL